MSSQSFADNDITLAAPWNVLPEYFGNNVSCGEMIPPIPGRRTTRREGVRTGQGSFPSPRRFPHKVPGEQQNLIRTSVFDRTHVKLFRHHCSGLSSQKES